MDGFFGRLPKRGAVFEIRNVRDVTAVVFTVKDINMVISHLTTVHFLFEVC